MRKSLSWLFLIIALLHFIVPVLPTFGIGESLGQRATAQGIGPELPPGPFFSIWGVIFTLYAVVAWRHLRAPSYTGQQIFLPLLLAGLGNLVWMLTAQILGANQIEFVLLLPILIFSWWGCYRFRAQTTGYNGTLLSLVQGACIGLFAGWLTIAVSISLPELVREVLGRGSSDAVWQSLWMSLLPATVLALIFTRYISQNWGYYLAVSWGLLGIFWNTYFRLEVHALGLMTLCVAFLFYRLARRVPLRAR